MYRVRRLLDYLRSVTHLFNPMFTFFAVQGQLYFLTVANYEIYLPPNVGCRADGDLCSFIPTFSAVTHRITAISTAGDYIITGDENGDLVLRDLLTPKVVQSLALQLPIQVTSQKCSLIKV